MLKPSLIQFTSNILKSTEIIIVHIFYLKILYLPKDVFSRYLTKKFFQLKTEQLLIFCYNVTSYCTEYIDTKS